MLLRLPNELKYRVLAFLDAKDVCNVRQMCRALATIGLEDIVRRGDGGLHLHFSVSISDLLILKSLLSNGTITKRITKISLCCALFDESDAGQVAATRECHGRLGPTLAQCKLIYKLIYSQHPYGSVELPVISELKEVLQMLAKLRNITVIDLHVGCTIKSMSLTELPFAFRKCMLSMLERRKKTFMEEEIPAKLKSFREQWNVLDERFNYEDLIPHFVRCEEAAREVLVREKIQSIRDRQSLSLDWTLHIIMNAIDAADYKQGNISFCIEGHSARAELKHDKEMVELVHGIGIFTWRSLDDVGREYGQKMSNFLANKISSSDQATSRIGNAARGVTWCGASAWQEPESIFYSEVLKRLYRCTKRSSAEFRVESGIENWETFHRRHTSLFSPPMKGIRRLHVFNFVLDSASKLADVICASSKLQHLALTDICVPGNWDRVLKVLLATVENAENAKRKPLETLHLEKLCQKVDSGPAARGNYTDSITVHGSENIKRALNRLSASYTTVRAPNDMIQRDFHRMVVFSTDPVI